MHYVYVLKSEKDEKLYVGHTNNLKKRFGEHCNGDVATTKNRRPLRLIYYEASNSLQDAIRREKGLKTGFGRAYLKRRIKLQDTQKYLDKHHFGARILNLS